MNHSKLFTFDRISKMFDSIPKKNFYDWPKSQRAAKKVFCLLSSVTPQDILDREKDGIYHQHMRVSVMKSRTKNLEFFFRSNRFFPNFFLFHLFSENNFHLFLSRIFILRKICFHRKKNEEGKKLFLGWIAKLSRISRILLIFSADNSRQSCLQTHNILIKLINVNSTLS